MGGKFGEMSTLMNYTFQSFNFRARQGARPFYDLVSNIAAEEYGHIELVAADDQHDAHRRRREAATLPEPDERCSTRSTSSPAARGRCPGLERQAVERRLRVLLRRPRRGPDAQLLPRDRRAQQQAQGLRDGRPPGGARADRLPARARRRAPGRLRARGREAHRRRPVEAVPVAADPDRQDPRVPAAHRARRAHSSSTASHRTTTSSWPPSSTGRTPRPARSSRSSTRRPRASPPTTCPPQPAVFAPDYAPEEIAEIAQRLREEAGLPDEVSGEVVTV